MAAINEAAGVVLPMPMSPTISRSAPAAISSAAMAAPAASARSVSAGVSASSRSMAPEDRRILYAPTVGRQLGQVRVHREVQHPYGHVVLPGQDADARHPGHEGTDHGGGDLARIGGDAGARP